MSCCTPCARLEPLSRNRTERDELGSTARCRIALTARAQADEGGLVRAPPAHVRRARDRADAGAQARPRQAPLCARLARARRRPREPTNMPQAAAMRELREEIGMTAHGRVRFGCELEEARRLQARPRRDADRRGRPLPAAPLVVGGRAGRRIRPRRACRRHLADDLRWIAALRDRHLGMHRLFVAIRPPEPIRDLLIDAMDDSPDFRWQDEEQLHLTLRFVGEVERPVANDLADALGRIRAVAVRAAHRRRRPLRAAQFRRSMGRRRAEGARRRPRRQGRARLPVGRPRARAPRLPPAHHPRPLEGPPHPRSEGLPRTHARPVVGPFAVDEFILFESRLSRHGAHYEEVARYPLE